MDGPFILLLSVYAVLYIGMIAIILSMAFDFGHIFKPKHYNNINPLYKIYCGINTEIAIVTYKSNMNRFNICNCMYWLIKQEIDRFWSLDRMLILDIDTDTVYCPNFGNFTMNNSMNINYIEDRDNFTKIGIADKDNHIDYVFKYREVI